MRLIGLMGLMVVSVVGAQAATVVVPVLHYTGSTNLRPFTIKLTSQEPVSYGSSLVFGTPMRVTPTNALQEVRLLPATYTILFDGASTPVAFAVPDSTNTYYLNDLVTRGITLLVAGNATDTNAIAEMIAPKLTAVRGTGSNLFLNGEIFFGGTNLYGDARVFADPDSGDFRILDSRGDIGLALHHDTLSAPFFQGSNPDTQNLWEVRDPDSFAVVMGLGTNGVLHVNGGGITNVPMASVNGLTELSNRVAEVEEEVANLPTGGTGTNSITVTGTTTTGSYVTLWTNAVTGSNWVGTVAVTVVGSGPVNRYVEEITWSVVCSNGVTWVASTNGTRAGKSSYLQSFEEVDEFTHVGVGWTTGPFGLYFSTTGGGVGNANPRDGISTIAALNTGTSASAVVSVRSGVNVVDASMYTGITNEWRLLVDDLSTTAEHFAMRSGFQDSFAAAADVDAACFVYSQTTNSGKFLAFCSSGSVTTTADTGVTVVADAWYRLQIALSGGKAFFFVNGTLVATITTHVPGAGNYMGFGTTLLKQAGTGTRYLMMDFCRLAFELPTSR